jgi:hypothetical protein
MAYVYDMTQLARPQRIEAPPTPVEKEQVQRAKLPSHVFCVVAISGALIIQVCLLRQTVFVFKTTQCGEVK